MVCNLREGMGFCVELTQIICKSSENVTTAAILLNNWDPWSDEELCLQ